MQGANFESARVEIARDQVARTPSPPATRKTVTLIGFVVRLVKGTPTLIIASRAQRRNPLNCLSFTPSDGQIAHCRLVRLIGLVLPLAEPAPLQVLATSEPVEWRCA
jgi:hypothetical protein